MCVDEGSLWTNILSDTVDQQHDAKVGNERYTPRQPDQRLHYTILLSQLTVLAERALLHISCGEHAI